MRIRILHSKGGFNVSIFSVYVCERETDAKEKEGKTVRNI